MLGILNIQVDEDNKDKVATRKNNGNVIASAVRSAPNYSTIKEDTKSTSTTTYKKSWFHKRFGNFDVRFLKPLLTHSKPSLEETCCTTGCCQAIAKVLTTDRQRNHAIQSLDEEDATAYETRRGETPLDDFHRENNNNNKTEFPNLVVERPEGETILENEDEGLEAANIFIDKDNNVKY
jgi:hypothetical protein